ncbi:MAG TPA: DUF3048 domain-containing protein [Acidimicrobiales bacterium]|nr:DUF3048 domain-containing protein [Acidimicrobiales bacterium]
MTKPPAQHVRTRPQAHTRLYLGLGAVAAIGLSGLALSTCTSSPPAHTGARATTTTKAPPPPPPTCPLTGTAAPAGVPARPALGVKIDNIPAARPQSGLDKADVVFEEPVEGGITRLVAVFQCQEAPSVGPVRSARNVDIGILGQLGNPLEVHVGGIQPVLANINASPIVNVDLGAYGAIENHPAGRYAPEDTYSTTALMWGTHPTMTTPPPPLFAFSPTAPAGSPVASVHVPFSGYSDVTWKYNAAISAFQRFYNGTAPDMLADGAQTTAANVIVQYVHISYGPWVESGCCSLEVQSDLYPGASGRSEVFRGGVAIPGTWTRSTLGSATRFVNAAGAPINLQPGQTWVELLPDTITATTTP